MRVLLINPPFFRYGGLKGVGGVMIPLNLCYLVAYARQQHPEAEFKILDAEANDLSLEETSTQAINFKPNLIGITTTTSAFDAIMGLCEFLKSSVPDVPIVLGGPHVSALPEVSLRETAADFVAIGEGEVTFSELISVLKGEKKDFSDIDGLSFFENGKVFHRTKPRQLLADLDVLPFPARDLVDNRLYMPPPTKRVNLGINTIISTSRGCPHNCGFCSFKVVWGRKTRVRSPQSVVAEIKECVQKFGVASINFADEFFTAQKKRVLEICKLIRKENLIVPWVCSARASRLDRETLESMKRAGCHEISFGVESGNPEILKRMDKHLDLVEVERVIRLTQDIGITTHASYVLGYPGETVETIKDTIRFAKKLNTDIAAFFIATPLPGSRLYQEALENRFLRPDSTWLDYSMISNQPSVLETPDLPAATLRYWHRRALRSYYFRPRYLLTRLSRIRGWHEIINLIEGLKVYISIKK
jgi:anaerobic magnesium-protoporphyrin IX monomethyl ester cyclase